ncbi:MAG: 2-aminoadipate transaminase, partial [Solirubrobacteraceae bacterium]|nr:2-aminoadipate transaminase [Solirubrobacteraceae bacterium]
GSSSMRLNFAGITEENIHEGIRRIGKAIRTQLDLLGSLSGRPAPARAGPEASDSDARPLADVVALPRREEPRAGRCSQDR